jgi:hypothetical protein
MFMKSLFREYPAGVTALVAALVLVSALGLLPGTTPVALIMKIVPDVEKKIPAMEWNAAQKGDQLNAGDQVRTGKTGLAILRFLDKSIVRVREKSLVTVNGDAATGKYTKVVDIHDGAVGFDIRKQVNEQFRFTSPTSVASIRGTQGLLTDFQSNDTLIVVVGLVNLKNIPGDKDLDIPAGYIGFSGSDGSLTSRQATADELSYATSLATGGTGSELKFELKDPKGNKKDLKIKFKQ